MATVVSAASLCGQGIVVMDCRGAFDAIESQRGEPMPKSQLMDQFTAFITSMEQESAAVKRDRVLIQKMREDRMVLQAQADTVATVREMITQLRKGTVVLTRLQCSIVTMPAGVAKEQGLTPRNWTTMDLDEFGKLVRAAAAAKGKLQNLPEVRLAPLQPFTMEPRPKRGAKEKVEKQSDVAPDPKALRVVAEMVPVSDTEVAMDLYVARGEPPKGASGPRFYALAAKIVRMEAGSGCVVAIEDGDQAIVVYVRCSEVGNGKDTTVQPLQTAEPVPGTAPAGKK